MVVLATTVGPNFDCMASSTRVGPGVAAAGAAAATAPEAERTDVPEGGRPTRKRVDRPEIDLDANIRDARETIQKAQAALTQARQQAKADRRKKARLSYSQADGWKTI